MPVEIKDKVKDWILCHWGKIVFVMFEKVYSDVSPRPGGKMFTIVCNNVVSSSSSSSSCSSCSRPSIQAFYKTQSPLDHLFFKRQWKCSVNFNWRQYCAPVYYERVEAGRLESCWFLPCSMPRLTPEVLWAPWKRTPWPVFESYLRLLRALWTSRGVRKLPCFVLRKGFRIFSHLPPSPLLPLPKLALLSSMEPSPVGFAL